MEAAKFARRVIPQTVVFALLKTGTVLFHQMELLLELALNVLMDTGYHQMDAFLYLLEQTALPIIKPLEYA